MDAKATAVSLLIAIGLWTAIPAGATDPDPLARIVEQQRELQRDLDSMDGLTTRQRNVIRKMQAQVFALTDGRSSLDGMTIEQKVKLENALERINAELVNTRSARDAQNKCHIEKKTGSARSVARCGSQDERDRTREGARAWMEKPRICVPPGCGG